MNTLMFWRKETFSAALAEGADDVVLAITTDAYARTYRASVETAAPHPVRMASGLTYIPDRADERAPPLPSVSAHDTFSAVLADIRQRYGSPSAALVALQLELPVTPPLP
ncbi:hypothetical protein [Achromobacter aloeverae]|uniref:hypothetical protein n=1 Tax=Achromobacter aloeverae TaxID=1750518 RepID=UPI001F01F652|nr:hypothetical protein [Achromobacter aloeverae]